MTFIGPTAFRPVFTGDIDCLVTPTRTIWRRWHVRFNACTSISAAEAFDVMGPWRMMGALAKGRELLYQERMRRLGPKPKAPARYCCVECRVLTDAAHATGDGECPSCGGELLRARRAA